MSQHKHLYNSARWKRRRAAQLSVEPLCAYHLQLGQTEEATVADHIEPHRGDEELFFNGRLQSLCKPCHDAHKQAQEWNRDGILRGAGHDGAPLDQAHSWHRAAALGGASSTGGAYPAQGVGGANVWGSVVADRSLHSVHTPAKLEGGG